jgi:DNA polymerase-1
VGTYLLLDGHSLAFRAWFALQETAMATTGGQDTTVVYGFVSMTTRLLGDWKPDGMAVAFDRPEPTFRDGLVSDYKAGRTPAPDTFYGQLDLVRQFLDLLRVPVVDMQGYEADDVIASLATQLAAAGEDVIIVTGDRDAYQLVEDPHIRVLYNRRGVTDYVLYDEAGIVERTGVPAHLYPMLASLRGDPSDNLPGVPGVGEKTAAKLVNTYGDLDALFSHLDEMTPKLRASLAEAEAHVRKNLLVIPLVRDLETELELPADLRLGHSDIEGLRQLFGLLEMRAVRDRLFDALAALDGGEPPAPAEGEEAAGRGIDLDGLVAACTQLDVPQQAISVLVALRESGASLVVEPDWAGAAGRSALRGVALLTSAPDADAASWEAYHLGGTAATDPGVLSALARLLSSRPDAGPLDGFAAYRAKELMRALLAEGAGDATGLGIDIALAAYLADPAEGQAPLDEIATRRGVAPAGEAAVDAGNKQLSLDLDGSAGEAWVSTVWRAATIAELAPKMRQALGQAGAEQLYEEVERPLVRVLARMEVAGVGVDVAQLREISDELTGKTAALEAEIQELAGVEFKVNSTPQLRTVLYDKLGLKPTRKTKTGYSTDAATLESLLGQHDIIAALLSYRELEKLRSTYGEGLLSEVAADGRIHASFNQTVARTGRLSSDQPNLHNIPVRTEEGRRIRAAFVPAPGRQLLVADYNQIELRVIAHLADDPGLVEAFTTGVDIHRVTASRVFGVEPGDVTIAQRSKAKMISYGLAYGMEAYGLSRRLAIPVPEAAEILAQYFVAFPAVKAYMERTVAEARIRGFTETLYGRRRYLPDLDAGNYQVRQAAERQAMNAGIQGLAADIFKVALVRLDAAIEAGGYSSQIVLQVHDEVLVEVPAGEREAVGSLTESVMRGACELRVPLEVNVSWGSSWADAKGT